MLVHHLHGQVRQVAGSFNAFGGYQHATAAFLRLKPCIEILLGPDLFRYKIRHTQDSQDSTQKEQSPRVGKGNNEYARQSGSNHSERVKRHFEGTFDVREFLAQPWHSQSSPKQHEHVAGARDKAEEVHQANSSHQRADDHHHDDCHPGRTPLTEARERAWPNAIPTEGEGFACG